jgi:hypothetical protein
MVSTPSLFQYARRTWTRERACSECFSEGLGRGGRGPGPFPDGVPGLFGLNIEHLNSDVALNVISHHLITSRRSGCRIRKALAFQFESKAARDQFLEWKGIREEVLRTPPNALRSALSPMRSGEATCVLV